MQYTEEIEVQGYSLTVLLAMAVLLIIQAETVFLSWSFPESLKSI